MPKYSGESNSDSKILKTPDGNLVRCLYITNIPIHSSEKDLTNLLKHYGVVKQLYFKNNYQMKKTTYALVTYATPEEAYRMFSARTHLSLEGSRLYVSLADIWHQPTVGPDGTINYNPRSSRLNVEANKGDDCDNEEDEEEEEEDEEEKNGRIVQDCPIARLNDDCLLHIIEFIPFSHRHVISHVCRRWRNLMVSYYWSKITVLNFNLKPFSDIEFTEKRLNMYLRLCPSISSVHLSNKVMYSRNSEELPTSKSIVKIATLCPKLEELNLNGIELIDRPLATIAHCCKHLKSLTIKSCRFVDRDNEMISLMRKCQLETLRLANCNLKPGNWLKNLRPGLKSLSLLCCEMSHSSFISGLSNLKNCLQDLELIIDICSDPLDFKKLHNFSELLSIRYVNRSVHLQKTSTDMFMNLMCLEIEFNSFLTNDLLKGLVQHCKGLTVLNIANSKNLRLTSEGFIEVANLQELVKLNLSKNNINDDVLIAIAEKSKNLEILSVNLCRNITDTGCKRVVQNLMKLKEFHLVSCRNVTNKTVATAIEAVTFKPKKAKLILYAAESGIIEVLKKPHEKVELCMESTTCLNWLLCPSQQDFSDFLFDDEFDGEDDDDDDYDFDIHDEDDIYNYPPYDLDEFDINIEELEGLNPYNVYINIF